MKISNLLDKDIKIVEKKKIWFLIPAGIVVLAAVMMIIFNFTLGAPLEIGMDFAGGYTMNVKLGTKLNDDNKAEYKALIESVTEGLTDANGNKYGIKVSSLQNQGSGAEASIYVKYKAVASEEVMEDINEELRAALNDSIFKLIPEVTIQNGSLTAAYTEQVGSFFDNRVTAVTAAAAEQGLTISENDVSISEDGKTITVALGAAALTEAQQSALQSALEINDFYSGQVIAGDQVSASISSELLTTAICAIVIAIMLMLFYIAIRFELTSGLAAIVALFHDIIMMFCFMAIFHIEINSTFIAALITILGYSINNTIIIFDRVREAVKNGMAKSRNYAYVANYSVRDTLLRSLNTTLTTLITIGMVAIIGVRDIRVFALPIIAGLLAGTYSSICIAPSIWSLVKDRKKRAPGLKAKSEKAAVA